MRARGQLAESSERFGRIQLVLGMLDRDVRSALHATARDAIGESQPAFALSSGGFALTRARGSQLLADPRPDVDRVNWVWADNTLTRLQWQSVQPGPGPLQASSVALDGVADLRLEALSTQGRWHDQWPPQGAAPEVWPRALRWRADVKGLGEVERLIEFPDEVSP